MAYNTNGEYYFDPQMDSDDSEALENADRITQALKYKQNQANLKHQQDFMTETWQEALKEADITQVEYDQLYAQDPAGASEVMKAGMKNLAKSVAARKRDPKTGKFLKSEPGAQAAKPAGRTQPAQPSNIAESVTAAKARANKGQRVSEDTVNDILEMMLEDFR